MSATAALPTASVVAPDGPERRRVAAVEDFLDRHARDGHAGAARLMSPDGDEVPVPAQLFDVLRQIAATLAQGNGVAVSAIARELTTTEAARVLGMSRPTLIRLIDAGELPSHKVGTHRRVLLQDVLHVRRKQRQERIEAYEDFMLETDALGLNDE
jgi:excisionase family DNA binding protein